jgi:hypothetical protein
MGGRGWWPEYGPSALVISAFVVGVDFQQGIESAYALQFYGVAGFHRDSPVRD